MLFLLTADFFQNQLFRKILSGIIPSECQTDWPDLDSNFRQISQQTTLELSTHIITFDM